MLNAPKKSINEKPSSQQDKDKILESVTAQLEKEYGKGILMKLGTKQDVTIPYIPTGALTLDIALGIGGIPRGRVVEIYGLESSGKTTLSLHTIAEAQKIGGTCAFVDAEHALDPAYAKLIGVQIDELYISQPDSGEQALEIVETLVRSSAFDIIVVDSVAALVPKSEIDGNMGDAQVGAQARLMSQALRKLTGIVSKTQTSVIFINQIRQKIGVMFGNPETTTGGNALKFYSSVRLEVRKAETLKKGEEAFGARIRVKVVKNKIAPPFKQAEFDILFNEGISYEGCLIDAAEKEGILKKSGTWYSYGETRLGQGKDNVRQFLKENIDIRSEIEKKVRANVGIKPLVSINTDTQEQEPAKQDESDTNPPTSTKAKKS
jgi:recombination protein RecA